MNMDKDERPWHLAAACPGNRSPACRACRRMTLHHQFLKNGCKQRIHLLDPSARGKYCNNFDAEDIM